MPAVHPVSAKSVPGSSSHLTPFAHLHVVVDGVDVDVVVVVVVVIRGTVGPIHTVHGPVLSHCIVCHAYVTDLTANAHCTLVGIVVTIGKLYNKTCHLK
jgi:hypothetical protein